jgi:hypothetical protein
LHCLFVSSCLTLGPTLHCPFSVCSQAAGCFQKSKLRFFFPDNPVSASDGSLHTLATQCCHIWQGFGTAVLHEIAILARLPTRLAIFSAGLRVALLPRGRRPKQNGNSPPMGVWGRPARNR